MRPGRLVVVEDDPDVAGAMAEALRGDGHEVVTVGTGAGLLGHLEQQVPDLVLLDLGLPDASGLDLLPAIRAQGEPVSVVVVTGDSHVATVVEAMRRGAAHFLAKPLRLGQLRAEVERVLEQHRVARRASVYRERSEPAGGRVLPEMVGSSPATERVRRLVEQVAGTDSTVLLLGESGTGKGMIARGLHRASRRAGRSFVEVNCASLQPQLLESEVFGHERGAFTGAADRKPGLMEVADGGTLFLDEVTEIALSAQSKLLSALENRSFRRVGGVRELAVDIRLVAATNRDLEAAVRERAFREDLYFRLNVFAIVVPPLRERPGDVADLVGHFIATLSPAIGRTVRRASPAALDALDAYRWPGNVRELRNVVERGLILASGDTLELEHLPLAVNRPAAGGNAPLRPLADVERDHIEKAVAALDGNLKRTAEVLGISRSTLYEKLRRHGITVRRTGA